MLTSDSGGANSLASADRILLVGGYTEINEQLWAASAVLLGDDVAPKSARKARDAVHPTAASPVTFVTLAAGLRSASTVVMLGTSSACWLAARMVNDAVKAGGTAATALSHAANIAKTNHWNNRPISGAIQAAIPPEKFGKGRVLAPDPLRQVGRTS